ncbi:MAG TPA: hypothetical protein VK858_18815 [Longimicrobiales bacterium]|nr:hypothetical protein [Longimicrobiales bacterium]
MDEDIVAIIAITLLISIPLLAISARIALKPIAEAIARLRGEPAAVPHARALQDRRLADLEEEMDRVVAEMQSLREALQFREQLHGGEAKRLHIAPSEGEAP